MYAISHTDVMLMMSDDVHVCNITYRCSADDVIMSGIYKWHVEQLFHCGNKGFITQCECKR